TIKGTNDSPVADPDTNATDAVVESGVVNGGNTGTAGDSSATGNVLTNDTDVDAGHKAGLIVQGVSFAGTKGTLGAALTGKYGSLELNEDGTYIYRLDNTDKDTQALRQGETV